MKEEKEEIVHIECMDGPAGTLCGLDSEKKNINSWGILTFLISPASVNRRACKTCAKVLAKGERS